MNARGASGHSPQDPSVTAAPAMQVFENTSDLELLARCREGEAGAWEELYSEHFTFAWRMARRLGAPPADLEDVVQDAFSVAHRKLGDFHEGRFSTWLYRIVAHVVAGRRRRQKVRDFFAGILGNAETTHPVAVDDQVSARRALVRVEQLLNQLSPKKREVFALKELEGLTHEAIGELLGIPTATVRTRLFHARADFERLARAEGLEP